MKRLIGDIDNEEKIGKISLWKRFILLLVYIIRFILHDILHVLSHLSDRHKRRQLQRSIGRFLTLFYKKIMQESILKESAALTYITLLGFLPFLVLVIFLAPKVPFLSGANKLSNQLYQQFLPASAMDAGWMVSQLVAKQVTLNLFSFILVIVTSYSLFKVIRDTFDRILVMDFHPPQDLLSQLIKFFGTIIFGFLIILVLFSSSSLPVLSSLMNFPIFKKWLIYVAPFAMQFIGLVFLYMIMPSIKVKRSSLFRGALWTTVVWVVLKAGFDYYIYHLTNIETVFGVLKSEGAVLRVERELVERLL